MTANNETVATFTHLGTDYQIDHLGIGLGTQYGEYAVYQGDALVCDFASDAAGFKPEHRPPLPFTNDLIVLARQAVDAVNLATP